MSPTWSRNERHDRRLHGRDRLHVRLLPGTQSASHEAGLPQGGTAGARNRDGLRIGLRSGREHRHSCRSLHDAVVRHRFQSSPHRFRPDIVRGIRRRRPVLQRLLHRLRRPRRFARFRLHRLARRLELDIGPQPRGHRGVRAPTAETRRRSLHQLQCAARLRDHRADPPFTGRTHRHRRQQRSTDRRAHGGRPQFYREASRDQTGLLPRQSANCRTCRRTEGIGSALPGPRLFQQGLASDSFRRDGALAGGGGPQLCLLGPLPRRRRCGELGSRTARPHERDRGSYLSANGARFHGQPARPLRLLGQGCNPPIGRGPSPGTAP